MFKFQPIKPGRLIGTDKFRRRVFYKMEEVIPVFLRRKFSFARFHQPFAAVLIDRFEQAVAYFAGLFFR